MLQELTAQTGASGFAVASLLFFVAAWIVITVRVYRTRPDQFDAWAQLALDDGDDETDASHARTKA